jgi:hypothetical protein
MNKKQEISDLEVARKMIKIHQSAADRKLKFDLSLETVRKLLTYKTCYYTNREFEEDGAFSRSFDRVDSSKGYVEGNVVSCTVDINGKKSNLTFDEIAALYHKLKPANEEVINTEAYIKPEVEVRVKKPRPVRKKKIKIDNVDEKI